MDYYVVLGVSHNVSQADICRAYKQLSRQLHPDKGGSTEAFQELQEAFAV